MGALLVLGRRSEFLGCFLERKADSSPPHTPIGGGQGHVKPWMPRGVLQTHSLTWEANGVKCWVLPRRGELAALPGATRAERTDDDDDDNLMAVVTAMAVPPAICLRRFSTLAAH